MSSKDNSLLKLSKNQSQSWDNKSYPYEVDYNDHFETPLRAYEDILFLLDIVAPQKINRSKHQILYDPYYCNGKTIKQLSQLGYHSPNSNINSNQNQIQNQNKDKDKNQNQNQNQNQTGIIIHKKRDFYKDIQTNSIPLYDTFITNPPYSSNHKQKCLHFCIQQIQKYQKSFFILMPNYVACKDYFRQIINDLSSNVTIAYFVPNIPYEYEHPEGTGKTIPPFASIWFCGMKKSNMQLLKQQQIDTNSDKLITDNGQLVFDLHQLQIMGAVPTIKRLNPKQRKKRRQKSMEQQHSNSLTAVSTCDHTINNSLTKIKHDKDNQNKRRRNDLTNPNNNTKKKKKKSIYRDNISGIRTKKRF